MVDHGELVHEGDDDVRGPVADVSRLHAGAAWANRKHAGAAGVLEVVLYGGGRKL